MISKSFKLPKHSAEVIKNKTYDFANFYKTASENTLITGKKKSDESSSKENDNTPVMKSRIFKAKRLSIKKEKKDKLDDTNNISQPNIDQENLPHRLKKSKKNKTTSIPNVKEFKMDKDVNENVKSIMKTDESLDLIIVQSSSNPKKRNKSVSFMLEDNEEVVVKKSKSEQYSSNEKNIKSKKNKIRNHKVKEQKNTSNMKVVNIDICHISDNNTSQLINKNSENNILSQENRVLTETIKKDKKKNKKQKFEKDNNIVNINSQQDSKTDTEKDKKNKKPKKKNKTKESGEKEIKPDVVTEDLQNLKIGDNAHTLTNLLDEMALADKSKNKKNKKKFDKNKPKNITVTNEKAATENNEEKEKVKWMKRKWNKDKKGIVSDDKQSTSIIIENLPLKIMCNYKKFLMDHFAKFGIIKQVGVAELYSIEDPKVFTTTINFYSEDAAEKSLEEDNTLFEGSRIRIKRRMPPSQTTLVVRSYSELSEISLSSVFFGAGLIRNVRRIIKGKKSMSTAFIEFDGPETVKQAIKMAEDVKIEGKKIFVSKFEVRNKNKKQKGENKKAIESEDSDE